MPEVRLSSPERVLWPLSGTTKADLVGYYTRVAPVLLPYLRRRPVTLRRFPEGVTGVGFFQSRCPPHPPQVRTATMQFPRSGKSFEAAVLDDEAALLWAGNLSTLELHPYLHVVEDPEHPSYAVFDLDPGPPAGLPDAARVALAVRELLAADGLVAYPKSSGAKGLHVHVPLNGGATYAAAKRYARGVAAALAEARPDVVDRMPRDARQGRVFVDWSQNDPGKSTVAPYSPRALRVPTVATPLTWDEVADAAAGADPRRLVCGIDTVHERLERLGDPLAPVLTVRQQLPGSGADRGGSASA